MSYFQVPGMRSLTGFGMGIMPGENDWEPWRRRSMPFPTMPDPYELPDTLDDGSASTSTLTTDGTGQMTGRDVLGMALGLFGDSIARENGGEALMVPQFISAINARRETAAAQVRRQADFDDWQRGDDSALAQPQAGSIPNGQVPSAPVGPGTAPPQAGLPQGFDHREWDIVPDPQPPAQGMPGGMPIGPGGTHPHEGFLVPANFGSAPAEMTDMPAGAGFAPFSNASGPLDRGYSLDFAPKFDAADPGPFARPQPGAAAIPASDGSSEFASTPPETADANRMGWLPHIPLWGPSPASRQPARPPRPAPPRTMPKPSSINPAIAKPAQPRAGARQVSVVHLSPADVLNLKKVLETEWSQRAGPDQAKGIIDTILNRVASGHWGSTVSDVVNRRSQFTNINGRKAWKYGRHSVEQYPGGRVSRASSNFVDSYLAQRARGSASSVGTHLNYANPFFSDKTNLPWIMKFDGPVFGTGRDIHRHGTTPEWQKFCPKPFSIVLP